ncbi:MAG: Rne/Rng family ribonuclease, partial [Halanaerobiales bacterium]
ERESYDRIAGNIYRAVIRDVLPGMQACFVDIGLDKNAFLHLSDLYPHFNSRQREKWANKNLSIKELVQPGQEIMVQVEKEPIRSKGAKITCKISLPGRFLVFLPYENRIGVSRRIEEKKERKRLKKIADSIKGEEQGLIVRTNARNKKKYKIENDYNYLNSLWQQIYKRFRNNKAPALIYRDVDLIKQIARDHLSPDTDKVVIDNKNDYHRLKGLSSDLAPEVKNRIFHYNKEFPVFISYGIEKELDKALKRKVWLDSGGYIIFDSTEALVSIDVNTGKYTGSKDLQDTVFTTNMEAAEEIARQLRLRDIGGIIIIDFIDMEKKKHRQKVLNLLEKELKRDRTKTALLGLTKLGLVEMTRKKVRERYSELIQRECPYCKGSGKVISPETMALRVVRRLRRLAVEEDFSHVKLELHPEVVHALRSSRGKLNHLEKDLEAKVSVKGDNKLHYEDIKIDFR